MSLLNFALSSLVLVLCLTIAIAQESTTPAVASEPATSSATNASDSAEPPAAVPSAEAVPQAPIDENAKPTRKPSDGSSVTQPDLIHHGEETNKPGEPSTAHQSSPGQQNSTTPKKEGRNSAPKYFAEWLVYAVPVLVFSAMH